MEVFCRTCVGDIADIRSIAVPILLLLKNTTYGTLSETVAGSSGTFLIFLSPYESDTFDTSMSICCFFAFIQ